MDVGLLLGAIGTLITAIAGACYVIAKAWARIKEADRQSHRGARLLRRLWDWVEFKELQGQVPASLRQSIVDFLREEVDPDDDSSDA